MRATVGFGFLALAVVPIALQLPTAATAWPIAAVPAWFGISHLVASATGYQGCPEMGAIPTLLLGRPVATNCDIWRRIDRVIGADRKEGTARHCGCGR